MSIRAASNHRQRLRGWILLRPTLLTHILADACLGVLEGCAIAKVVYEPDRSDWEVFKKLANLGERERS